MTPVINSKPQDSHKTRYVAAVGMQALTMRIADVTPWKTKIAANIRALQSKARLR